VKVEAEITDEYKFTAQNKCDCMGQYYYEDDWQIEVYAPSMEELYEIAAKEIVLSGIDISWATFSRVSRLKYDGCIFDIINVNFIRSEEEQFLDDILKSETYKKLLKEKEDKKKLLKEEKRIADEIFLKEKRKQQYESLKKEFEV